MKASKPWIAKVIQIHSAFFPFTNVSYSQKSTTRASPSLFSQSCCCHTAEKLIQIHVYMEAKHRRLRLLRGQPFHINVKDADGRRFVRLFRQCWRQLPFNDRRKIISFWKNLEFPYPVFELSNMWEGVDENLGQTDENGARIRFNADAFPHMPDQAAVAVIAHELAHVFQKVLGRLPGGENEEENEQHANRIVDDWDINRNPRLWIIAAQEEKGLSFEDACEKVRKLVNELQ